MKNLILTIDQSTTSTKVLLINKNQEIIAEASKIHQKYFPKESYVEHDAMEIYENVLICIQQILAENQNWAKSIAAISITNQRETSIVWNKYTHLPVCHAIVWQCQRTQEACETLKLQGYVDRVKEKTGLMIDSYFSATKIKWILDHTEESIDDLLFGTMDSWLIYKLTGGVSHVCDHTNASRTLLYNLHKGGWDQELCDIFQIPQSILPEIKLSDEVFGMSHLNGLLEEAIPIVGVMGDSQAALYGERCYEKYSVKITMGTGSSIMVNTQENCLGVENGLVQALGWRLKKETVYTQEAIIHCNADSLNWLRDELHLFDNNEQLNEIMANEITNGLFFVPALLGLSFPYWQSKARAVLSGLSRTTTAKQIVKAALQGIVFQINDALNAYSKPIVLTTLHVNGGVSENPAVMQFLADISGLSVRVSANSNASAQGSYLLACKALGWRQSDAETATFYEPRMKQETRTILLQGWNQAIQSVLSNISK